MREPRGSEPLSWIAADGMDSGSRACEGTGSKRRPECLGRVISGLFAFLARAPWFNVERGQVPIRRIRHTPAPLTSLENATSDVRSRPALAEADSDRPDPEPRHRERRRWTRGSSLAVLAILAFGLAGAAIEQTPGPSQTSHFALVRALASGTAEIGPGISIDTSYINGSYFANKAPGLAFTLLPAYVTLRAAGAPGARASLRVTALAGHVVRCAATRRRAPRAGGRRRRAGRPGVRRAHRALARSRDDASPAVDAALRARAVGDSRLRRVRPARSRAPTPSLPLAHRGRGPPRGLRRGRRVPARDRDGRARGLRRVRGTRHRGGSARTRSAVSPGSCRSSRTTPGLSARRRFSATRTPLPASHRTAAPRASEAATRPPSTAFPCLTRASRCRCSSPRRGCSSWRRSVSSPSSASRRSGGRGAAPRRWSAAPCLRSSSPTTPRTTSPSAARDRDHGFSLRRSRFSRFPSRSP